MKKKTKYLINSIKNLLFNIITVFALFFKVVIALVILSYISINHNLTENTRIFLSLSFFAYLVYTFAIHITHWQYKNK